MIIDNLQGIISKKIAFQMVVKAINNSDGLVSTLLIFKAYLHIYITDLLIPIMIQKATTIKKTIDKIRKF